jgi:hypothetical protein
LIQSYRKEIIIISKIYFQDYIDDDTLIKGYIESDTKQGKAEVYKKINIIEIDIETTGFKKEPYLDKEYATNFAWEALERS